MNISDILIPERTLRRVDVTSKKRLLELVGDLCAETTAHVSAREVLKCLVERERLGSTGIGYGLAIPHGRIQSTEQPIGCLIHLKQAIDFDAIDGQHVDIVFALLVPEQSTDEHLQLLSTLAEMFSHEEVREQLRQAPSPQALYDNAVKYGRV